MTILQIRVQDRLLGDVTIEVENPIGFGDETMQRRAVRALLTEAVDKIGRVYQLPEQEAP